MAGDEGRRPQALSSARCCAPLSCGAPARPAAPKGPVKTLTEFSLGIGCSDRALPSGNARGMEIPASSRHLRGSSDHPAPSCPLRMWRGACQESGVRAGNAGYGPGKRGVGRECGISTRNGPGMWDMGRECGIRAGKAEREPECGMRAGNAVRAAEGAVTPPAEGGSRLRSRPAPGSALGSLPAFSRPSPGSLPAPLPAPHLAHSRPRSRPRVTVKANQPVEHNESNPKGAAEEPKRRWSRTSCLSLGC